MNIEYRTLNIQNRMNAFYRLFSVRWGIHASTELTVIRDGANTGSHHLY